MIPRRLTLATVTGLTAALALTACGGTKSDNAQNASTDGQARAVSEGVQGGAAAGATDGYGANENSAGGNSDGYGAGAESNAKAAGYTTTAVRAVKTATMGTIVVDDKKWTLYRFDKDSNSPAKSNCAGECAAKWPPILAKDAPQIEGIDEDLIGTVLRSDGQKQVTLKGWPLYRFAADKKGGVWKGHGVQGVWWAITDKGGKAVLCLPGMATAGNSWLRAKKTKTVGTIVVDNKQMTLYRFDKDSAKPSKSTCVGDCLKKWPALKWPGQKPQLKGIDPALVGKVQRPDGSLQTTLAGLPLYYYYLDKKPGDWKGIGVGGTWWAVQPNGKRAQKCRPGMTPAQSNALLENRASEKATKDDAYGGAGGGSSDGYSTSGY